MINEKHANVLQSRIPWWDGLDPVAKHELDLPSITTAPIQSADVVVIGGGVTGLSAAVSARNAGASVLLLESCTKLGYGATGQNAGILSAGINMGLADLPPESQETAFWPETTQVLLSLVAEAALPGSILSAHVTGAISLAESANAAKKLAREADARVAAGLRADLWTTIQIAEATGGRLSTRSVVGALWLPDEGRIHPLTLLAHLARLARAKGVMLVGQAQVNSYQEVVSGNDHHWELTLTNGTSIKACGLIRSVGPTSQPNARIYALAFAANLPDNFPLFWDASPYTYADFRPGNGRLVVSGGRYGRAGNSRRDATYHKRLANAARHWLPELESKEPVYKWAVDLEVASDMIPYIREIGKVAPGMAIEGLGALGVLPGIVLGRRAGAMVALQVD